LTQGWEDGYLWVCQDQSFEADSFAPDRCLGGSEEAGRIIRLKKHIHDSCKATWQSLSCDSKQLSARISRSSHELSEHQRQMKSLLRDVLNIKALVPAAGDAAVAEDSRAAARPSFLVELDDGDATSKEPAATCSEATGPPGLSSSVAMEEDTISEAVRAEVIVVRSDIQEIRKDMAEQREAQVELQRTARELADTLQAIRDAQQRHALRKAGRQEAETSHPTIVDAPSQAELPLHPEAPQLVAASVGVNAEAFVEGNLDPGSRTPTLHG